jgi:tetratricopeptide (TPR) repeat protein
MSARELLDIYEARGGEDVYEQARKAYEAALAAAPDDPVLLRDFGYLQECHGRRALDAAVTSYERAIELDPGDEKTHFQLIHAMTALGRQEEAIARYENTTQFRLLASAYLAARDYDAARRAVEAGLADSPEDATLAALEGDLLAATGDTTAALAAWQRALELDQDNISGHYSRAFLLEREGRPGEALDEWRAILAWAQARGYDLDAEWPRREIDRLQTQLGA